MITYKKILISMSLDHGYGDQAIEVAKALSADGGEIFAVHVYETLQGSASSFVSKEDVDKALTTAKNHIAERLQNVSGVQPRPGPKSADLSSDMTTERPSTANHLVAAD